MQNTFSWDHLKHFSKWSMQNAVIGWLFLDSQIVFMWRRAIIFNFFSGKFRGDGVEGKQLRLVCTYFPATTTKLLISGHALHCLAIVVHALSGNDLKDLILQLSQGWRCGWKCLFHQRMRIVRKVWGIHLAVAGKQTGQICWARLIL